MIKLKTNAGNAGLAGERLGQLAGPTPSGLESAKRGAEAASVAPLKSGGNLGRPFEEKHKSYSTLLAPACWVRARATERNWLRAAGPSRPQVPRANRMTSQGALPSG